MDRVQEVAAEPDALFDLVGGEVLREGAAAGVMRLADARLASPGYWLLDGRGRGLDRVHQASRADDATA